VAVCHAESPLRRRGDVQQPGDVGCLQLNAATAAEASRQAAEQPSSAQPQAINAPRWERANLAELLAALWQGNPLSGVASQRRSRPCRAGLSQLQRNRSVWWEAIPPRDPALHQKRCWAISGLTSSLNGFALRAPYACAKDGQPGPARPRAIT